MNTAPVQSLFDTLGLAHHDASRIMREVSAELTIKALPTLTDWTLSAWNQYPVGTIVFKAEDNSLNVVESSSGSTGTAIYESGKFYLGALGPRANRAPEVLESARAYALRLTEA